MIWTGLALVALSSPVAAQDCRFYNTAGQSLDYRPLDGEVVFETLYDGAVKCAFIGGGEGNGYPLACDDGPRTIVVGASEPEKEFADILVFDNVFFWLKCEETT